MPRIRTIPQQHRASPEPTGTWDHSSIKPVMTIHVQRLLLHVYSIYSQGPVVLRQLSDCRRQLAGSLEPVADGVSKVCA